MAAVIMAAVTVAVAEVFKHGNVHADAAEAFKHGNVHAATAKVLGNGLSCMAKYDMINRILAVVPHSRYWEIL